MESLFLKGLSLLKAQRILFTAMVTISPGNLLWSDDDKERRPNIVVILTDDQGYGDLGSHGHPSMETPQLDRMAEEGQRWTDFYAAANVCTPSRAALLTGRWPVRSGMISDRRFVFTANAAGGLPDEEITLAQHLRDSGYVTGALGKWHLGHLPQYLPLQRGFDEFFGTPYSNDERVAEHVREHFRRRDYWNTPLWYEPRSEYWNIPLMVGDKVIEQPTDQTTITHRTTKAALDFIRRHKGKPFFLYAAYHMPHVPLFASPPFQGKTARGLYGDVIAELDWGVGQILDLLREEGLDKRTLVVFTSDNGPWTVFRDHGGSTGSLRGDKGSTWEAGHRVPTIFWWPGKVPAGSVVRGIGTHLDFFATFSALLGKPIPGDRPMDSLNLGPALFHNEPSPREIMLYFRGTKIFALRQGFYKAHFSTMSGFGLDRVREDHDLPLLYHLGIDPEERYDIANNYPKIVTQLRRLRKKLQDNMTYGPDQLVEQLPLEN